MASLYNMYLIVFIVFAIAIILSNLATIGCVLFSRSLRRILRHQIMVSIALVDLLLGSFILPMMIRRLVEAEAPTCHLNAVLQAIGDHGVFFICGWSLVTLDLVFLVNITLPVSDCSKIRIPEWVKNLLITSWPWLLALTFLVPMIVSYQPTELTHRSHWRDPMCLMDFPRPILILLNTLCLYLPFFFCALILAVLIVHFIKRELSAMPTATTDEPRLIESADAPDGAGHHGNERGVGITNDGDDCTSSPPPPPTSRSYVEESVIYCTDHPLSVCLANLVYFLCYTPAAIHSLLAADPDSSSTSPSSSSFHYSSHRSFGASYASSSHPQDQPHPVDGQVSMLVVVSMLTRSVAIPLSWLAVSTLRHEAFGWVSLVCNWVGQVCCRRCSRAAGGGGGTRSISTVRVSYTGLREIQGI